jgi:electron transfer flavoprotein alpha subunit
MDNLYKGVCVYAEYKSSNSYIPKTTYQLVSIGQKIAAKLKVVLSVIIIGHNINKTIIKNYINIGVDNLYLCDDALLNYFQENIYSDILLRIIQVIHPEILLFSATSISIPLASIIAAKLDTGLTANCISLDIDLKTRNLKQITTDMKIVLIPYNRPQIVTLKPKIFNKLQKQSKSIRNGKIIKFPINKKTIYNKIKLISIKKCNIYNIYENLDDADVIVGVGRGVQNYKVFELIKEFTMLIHGKLAASKCIVDLGWVPDYCQIGQTGISVNPRIYVACGISGAKQHTIGLNTSSTIISINLDPNCYMMQTANFALQGDLCEIIPQFILQLNDSNNFQN